MTEIQILTALKNNGGFLGYTDLLNIGLSDAPNDPLLDRDLINKLIKDDILSGDTAAYATITFGKHGRLRLQELQQIEQAKAKQAAQKAKETRAQRRHDWFVALVGAAVGAILGVVGTLVLQLL